ncbi:class C sortase [Coriobacterium glomerans]|nr:class C sortase [Coriobacterium glomerans]
MGRKRAASICLAAFGLLIGAAMIAYPAMSSWLHQQAQNRVVQQQGAEIRRNSDTKLVEERARAIAYNERLRAGGPSVSDSFGSSAARSTDAEYDAIMNLSGDGVMGTLIIPAIDFTMPIYHGVAKTTLQQGVGHLPGTSLPIGGPSTHAVLSGHTGLPSARIFDDLDRVRVGDYFVVAALGEDHAYRITSIEVVRPDETDSLRVREGADLVTLVTCTPYGVNTHRLLVHGERCPVPDEWGRHERSEASRAGRGASLDAELLRSMAIGAAAAVIISLFLIFWSRRRSRRHRS